MEYTKAELLSVFEQAKADLDAARANLTKAKANLRKVEETLAIVRSRPANRRWEHDNQG